MLNKQRLCYLARKHYPEVCGIRKALQREKVRRLFRFMLTKEEIAAVEKNPLAMHDTIAPYLVKWEKYLRPAVAEMEDILKNAPHYKDRTDKDALRDDMMFCRLAYGFIPSEYVGFEFEHKSPKERKQFCSDIDTNYFGYSVNNIQKLQTILDKGECFKRFRQYFQRDGIVIEKESDLAAFTEFVKKHPVFVKKAVFSCMGRGIELVNMADQNKPETYFRKLISEGKYLLEERVIQREEMACFNQSSVNTVRCITFKSKNGMLTPYCFMRTGRNGSFVDNGGAGGIIIGIDVASGTLNTDGYDEYGDRYPSHPDTGIVFQGHSLPDWENLLNFCKTAASKVSDISYLSWDLAYTDNGWDVIEINEVGQFIGPQTVTKRGIKQELFQYLKQMDKVI